MCSTGDKIHYLFRVKYTKLGIKKNIYGTEMLMWPVQSVVWPLKKDNSMAK